MTLYLTHQHDITWLKVVRPEKETKVFAWKLPRSVYPTAEDIVNELNRGEGVAT